jgi:hypothetical protein
VRLCENPPRDSQKRTHTTALDQSALLVLANRRAKPHRQRDSGVVFLPPLTGALRDPSNVSGDLRQLLDSFDCSACAGTGYQFNDDGSAKTEPGGRRIRCTSALKTNPAATRTSRPHRPRSKSGVAELFENGGGAGRGDGAAEVDVGGHRGVAVAELVGLSRLWCSCGCS